MRISDNPIVIVPLLFVVVVFLELLITWPIIRMQQHQLIIAKKLITSQTNCSLALQMVNKFYVVKAKQVSLIVAEQELIYSMHKKTKFNGAFQNGVTDITLLKDVYEKTPAAIVKSLIKICASPKNIHR